MVTENDIRCQSHARQDRQTMEREAPKLFRLKVQKHAMAEIVSCSATSGETLMKASVSTSSGCLFCGTEKCDSQKRTNLKGRLKISLREQPILWTSHWFLRNIRCYKNIKRLEKCQEEVSVKHEIKSSLASANGFKRGARVPSDFTVHSCIVAPIRAARHLTNARHIKMSKRVRV